MGTDTKARIARMKTLLELQNTIFRKQEARTGVGLYPMRLLKEDIERRRTPKERERGWINDYKGGTKLKNSFEQLEEQLVLSRKILGREPDNPQSFIASLNSSKGKGNVRMHGRERGWTNRIDKERTVNESLYGMSKPTLQRHHSPPQTTAEGKLLQSKSLQNARKLETGWVSFGREQDKGRAGLGGTLGKPRGLTSSELQSLQKATATEKQERESGATGGTTERSAVSHGQKSSGSRASVEWRQGQRQKKYHARLVVPIGTLERAGFGNASYRARITPEGQRDKYNQLVETGWVHRYDAAAQRQLSDSEPAKGRSDADILKEGIEKEEEEGWMSSYRRKQTRELCRLAKQRDKTASQVLKESHDKYREEGWINPLQRQKPGVYVLGSRRTAAEMTSA